MTVAIAPGAAADAGNGRRRGAAAAIRGGRLAPGRRAVRTLPAQESAQEEAR